MNNEGFTLIELLSTLIILGIVIGITIVSLNIDFGETKEKTEEVFVDTLRDAIDMYLSSEFGNLKIGGQCSKTILKKHNSAVKVYKVKKNNGSSIKFSDVISSKYKPLVESEFFNPANEKKCEKNIVINVYRDEDFVYYYSVNKSTLKCLKNIGGEYDNVITNLPKVDTDGNGIINDEDGYFRCS